jgi:hypothetical protein
VHGALCCDSLLTVASRNYQVLIEDTLLLPVLVSAVNAFRMFLVILVVLPLVPYFASLMNGMYDDRVEYVLHAMPAETQLVSVVNAPNIVFDQPVIQGLDEKTCLQLFALRCFWDIYNEIHQKDVSLSVHCTLEPERKGSAQSKYPTGHFVFLTSNESRDKKIQQQLHDQASAICMVGSRTVYELPDCKWFCLPKPALIIYTNDKVLMHTILSRLDAWWLIRVAMPNSLIEWKYANQEAPYWGVRHFPSDDSTSPAHDRSVLDDQAIGLTFQYTDNAHDLQMMYISNNANQRRLASKLIKGVDPWTARHIFCNYIDGCATHVTVSDSRCLGVAVYAALAWFDPPFALELEQIRHHHR